jgi:hypothetical protein
MFVFGDFVADRIARKPLVEVVILTALLASLRWDGLG